MAEQTTLKTIAIDAALHRRIDMYAAANCLSIREVVDTAVKLFLPMEKKVERVREAES